MHDLIVQLKMVRVKHIHVNQFENGLNKAGYILAFSYQPRDSPILEVIVRG